jgi:hypothetical protein
MGERESEPFVRLPPNLRLTASALDREGAILESIDHRQLLEHVHFFPPIMDCYHGSSNGMFFSPYHEKLHQLAAAMMKNSITQVELHAVVKTFSESNWLVLDFVIFAKHAFAFATILRLQIEIDRNATFARNLLDTVNMIGLVCQYDWIPNKYCHPREPPHLRQYCKFAQKVRSNRGLVTCIDKHNACNCLAPLLDRLPKTDACFVCRREVPEGQMLECRGCKLVWYCNAVCQKNGW